MAKAQIQLDSQRIITRNNHPPLEDLRDGALVLIHKDLDWTSFDVVNKLRSTIKYALNIKKMKVGHAGTLDPRATGLLLVCIGKYTKLVDRLTAHTKVYEAQFKLGAVTATYDAESDEENPAAIDHLSPADLDAAAQKFMGQIDQVPPIYSAVKIGGQTAYTLARRGEDVTLEARPITIFAFDRLSFEPPFVDYRISCSKGTYIRSLAHDFGQALGCGAYLSGLVRSRIEDFALDDALTVEEACEWIKSLPAQTDIGSE